MERLEIERQLKEKYDDEYTIKMFTTYVLEFQKCFSDIMDTEEVIRRIKKNIFGNIIIENEFDNKSLDGKYDKDGFIKLKRSTTQNDKYTRYLLFHEMTHAITSVRDENGKETMLGFSYLQNQYGMGFNEAMTEYLTQLRNKIIEEDSSDLISGYRTIVEQIRRLSLIIGKDVMIKTFFYQPQNFKKIICENGMDYDELEKAFRFFIGKDDDVRNIGEGRRLLVNQNYNMYKFANMIFNNYTKAIGEVNTLEDFQKKYKIFQTYTEGRYDCIVTMYTLYYRSIGKDIDQLLQNGISFEEIRKVLEGLNIDISTLKVMYVFSKCFNDDKNKTAVNLYEYFRKNPNLFQNVATALGNYAILFDHFKEYDCNPASESLYDIFRYPIIGQLLKEHPEIDYAEVSFDEVIEKYYKLHIYIFPTHDGNKYAYSLDGRKITHIKNDQNNDIFKIEIDQNVCLSLICTQGKLSQYSFHSTSDVDLREEISQVDFQISHSYSEKEDIEYFIENGEDTDGKLKQTLNNILNRIKSRSTARDA